MVGELVCGVVEGSQGGKGREGEDQGGAGKPTEELSQLIQRGMAMLAIVIVVAMEQRAVSNVWAVLGVTHQREKQEGCQRRQFVESWLRDGLVLN